MTLSEVCVTACSWVFGACLRVVAVSEQVGM